MSRTTFRMIVIISSAHALVHVFELSLPSVEQMIGEEFEVGTAKTGALGTVWRLPFGVGALLAGILADRFGSKPMLLVYLIGCTSMCIAASFATSLTELFVTMFAMGCFASIYHPAGLAMISRETTPENRGAALGWHGIFGSIGIAGAPFMAALAFSTGAITWRGYYLVLTLPALAIAALIAFALTEHRSRNITSETATDDTLPEEANESQWKRYLFLVFIGALSGFVYAGFMHFLPRYLDTSGLRPAGIPEESFRNALSAVVLLCGVVGQAIAGRLAQPGRLESLLAVILLLNVPFLFWMAVAEGHYRLWATCGLALVHFMNQPVYNSLIAQYVAGTRRSTAYGFSNMFCFGIGALGPSYAGYMQTDFWTYAGLGIVASMACLCAVLLRSVRSK